MAVQTKTILGIVKDAKGKPVQNAIVFMYRCSDEILVGETETNKTGKFAFERDSADPNHYYVFTAGKENKITFESK